MERNPGKIISAPEADYFLDNAPRQPKTEIANYIESFGIPVPHRFADLKEALWSKKPFIIRSEHPQDYAGASGIVDSVIVNDKYIEMARRSLERGSNSVYAVPRQRERADIFDNILVNIGNLSQKEIEDSIIRMSKKTIDEYVRLKRIPPKVFENKITFSYWEYFDGLSQTIVADSAIENRYHTFSNERKPFYYSYIINENGENIIFKNTKRKDPPNVAESIEFYESIRTLPAFQKENIPIVESVVADGKRYFLQYLRGRSFSPPDFTLERPPEANEVEAKWVRGTTSKNGLTCETSFWYKDSGLDAELVNEEASFDFHFNSIFSELMTPNRKIQYLYGFNLDHMVLKSIDMHLQKSKLFRPDVSVFMLENDLIKMIPEFKYDTTHHPTPKKLGVKKYEDFRATLSVISDGRKAYISRVG